MAWVCTCEYRALPRAGYFALLAPGSAALAKPKWGRSTHITSLHDARELARQFSGQLRDGINPLVARKAADEARKLETSKSKTLGFCAEEWFVYKIKRSDWHEKTHKPAKSILRNTSIQN